MTHLVVFISCEPQEIRNCSAFERAAEFGRYEGTIELRCSDGRRMQYTCSGDGVVCPGWRYFHDEWEKRHHGP